MAPPFAAPFLLRLVLVAAVAVAAPHNEGCDCESTCADIVARQQKEIARLHAELRAVRGNVDPAGRRLSCASSWEVSSDAELEAFVREGCSAVTSLSIGGNTTSLASLARLETVDDLKIRHSENLTSLAGLENLTRVERLTIESNVALRSLVGLQGLETVGEVTIKANHELQSLAGLENLARVEGRLHINGNTQLRSLAGLEGLETVGELNLNNNDGLTSLTGLQGLETAREIYIHYNDGLQSLMGLENLTGVEEGLNIQDNDGLKSLAGLHGLEAAGKVKVLWNDELTSLEGLRGLKTAGHVWIQGNNELGSLAGLENLSRVEKLEIKDSAGLKSLAGLQGLKTVGWIDIYYNTGLISLDALQGVETATLVRVWYNRGLQSLIGLENLVRVEERLEIVHNYALRSLAGLEGLVSAHEIEVDGNHLLESLSGLESVMRTGKLTINNLLELRSIAALRSLTNVWHAGILISDCPKLHSLDGLGTLQVSLLQVQRTPLECVGGPFATGSSVHAVRFDETWPRCVTPHERTSLLSVVEDIEVSTIFNASWQPDCGTDAGTFSCTRGQPCNFSLPGFGGNYTSIFVSARFRGCGACAVNDPQSDVGVGGRVDLGYVLRDEEAGLHSVCRCAGGIGPVAQLLLRGPRPSTFKACSRGRNCTFRLEGEGLERTDRVVIMKSCSDSAPSSGFTPSLTSDSTYVLHDPLTWYNAPAARYQVCWRAPCTSAPDGPTCPAPENSYLHIGDLELIGAYARNYMPVLGRYAPFATPNIGLGVADGDQMRLMRACGEADEYVLAANSTGMVFDFGLLTEDRVQGGEHHLCWCHERDGEECNAAWHFRADAGVVQIQCPAGQELVDSRRCESCPAWMQQPDPGLEPCYPDPERLSLLAVFSLVVGVISAILVLTINRRLSVVDVSLIQDQTIVTTSRRHHLSNASRPSFPVKFHGTGHPELDSPSASFQATVKDALRLELLTSAGKSIDWRLDTSMGTLSVDFPHDLRHQNIVRLGLPMLFTVAAVLGGLILSLGLIAQALPLTRIWCIFELLQTVKLERSEATFEGLLLCTSGGVLNTGGGSPEVAMALAEKVAGMNLQTAQATSASDAAMIREEVNRGMGSFGALNRFICGEMRSMLVRAQQHADQHFVGVLQHLDQTIDANV